MNSPVVPEQHYVYCLLLLLLKLYVAEVFFLLSSLSLSFSNQGVFVDAVEASVALCHHSGRFTDVLFVLVVRCFRESGFEEVRVHGLR